MEYDVSKILIYGVLMITGIALLISLKARIRDCRLSKYFLVIGGIVFLGSVVVNSATEKNWSWEFIVDYLLIKEVGIVGLRKTIMFSYACYVWSLTAFILATINRMRIKEEGCEKGRNSMFSFKLPNPLAFVRLDFSDNERTELPYDYPKHRWFMGSYDIKRRDWKGLRVKPSNNI